MFDRLDEQRAVSQAGAPRAIQDVVDERGNGGDFAVLLADERDARIRLGGPERHVAGSPEKSPGPVSDASRETVL